MKTFYISFFSVSVLCFIATPVLACNCIEAKSAKAGLKSANAVFVGKVVDIGHQKFFTKAKADLGGGKSKMVTVEEHFYKVKFVVSQSWKGAPDRTTFVLTHFAGSPACGYSFSKGKTYLVYANTRRKPRSKADKDLYTSTCARTENVSKAKKDLAELGKGKVPQR